MTARKKAAEPAVEEEAATPAPEQAPQPEPQPEPEQAPPPQPEQIPAPQPEQEFEQPTSPEGVVPKLFGMVYFLPTSNTMGTTTESGASFALAAGVPVKMTAADAAALVAEGLGSIKGD